MITIPDLKILHSKQLKRMLPARIKEIIRNRVDSTRYQIEECRRAAEYLYGGPIPDRSDYEPKHDLRIGIIKDRSYYYAYNVRACTDMEVSYHVIDIENSDWIDVISGSACDVYLIWPSVLLSIWKQIYDERLDLMEEVLRKRIFPSSHEIRLLENKRRVRDWLVAHNVPHPRTWVFYDKELALAWIGSSRLPVVCKTNIGASGIGVFILRDRRQAMDTVHRAFSQGIGTRRGDIRDRQWGYVILQEYIPHENEWRIVRIGNDFLCRKKTRVGDHASGSGVIGWALPEPGMLDFVNEITDIGNFRSMAVDLFVNPNGDPPFLVNELQCLFGAIQREDNVNETTGIWHLEDGGWVFRSGYYYQNACANLRVQWLLRNH